MPLCSKEALDFALDVPDPSNVIVGASKQIVTLVAPLNGLDEVVLVGTLRHFIIALRQTDMPQLNQWLLLCDRRSLDHSI